MEDGIIELSDSDSESRPPQQESREISLLNSELAQLSAVLAAKSKLVMEQGKELNKLRKENGHLRNERDMQSAEIAGLQDELKNILRQLPDHTVKNLKLGLIKLNNSDHGLRGGTVGGTRHQDDVQVMFESDDLASRSPVHEDVPAEAGSSQFQNPASSGSHAAIKREPEEIAVVIKSEEVPDLKTLVTFVSEDGKFDIWNLEHLDLGPPVVVEKRSRIRFTRTVINNVIGGYQSTFNNWQGPNNFHNPLAFSSRRSMLVGGNIVERVGKEDTNDRLVNEAEITGREVCLVQYTNDGLREALEDGRLVVGFTVLKCTGYRTQWLEQLWDQGAHSKVKSQNNSKRKKASSGGKLPPAKRVKGSTKQEKVMLPESDGDDDEPGSSDVEYVKARLGLV